MRTSRTAPAAVSLLLLLAGCSDDEPRRPAAASSEEPSATPSAAEATPSATPEPATAAPTLRRASRAVYFVRDTGRSVRLYREFHPRPGTTGVVRDAVEAMLTVTPFDRDYTSLWPRGTRVRGARIEGTTAYVDLSREARTASAGAGAEQASLQQLVHTVTAAAPKVTAVQLLVEGSAPETLWGHVDTRRPLRRQPAAEVLGPVWVLAPASLARGAQVRGEASTFEANVTWEWRQGDRVVEQGFSTAATAAPGRGAWTAPVDVPPGQYVFRAYEASAEDGRPLYVDDKPVTVTG